MCMHNGTFCIRLCHTIIFIYTLTDLVDGSSWTVYFLFVEVKIIRYVTEFIDRGDYFQNKDGGTSFDPIKSLDRCSAGRLMLGSSM